MAADRTPNDLADFIARKGKNRRSYALAHPAGSRMRAEIMAEADQYDAAAALLREQAEQLDTLRNAMHALDNAVCGAVNELESRTTQSVRWGPQRRDNLARRLRRALTAARSAAGGGVPGEGR